MYPDEFCLLYTVISSKAESSHTPYIQNIITLGERRQGAQIALNFMPYLDLDLKKAVSHGRF